MPAYDYAAGDPAKGCDHCRAGFEVVHSMKDAGPRKCPECGGAVRRVIGPVNVSAGRWSSKRLLNKDNIHRQGFKTGTDLLESGDLKL